MTSSSSIGAVLEAKLAKLEAELERISRPPDGAGGISFGKRVGEGTSMAVDRLEQVAVYDEMQALLVEVRRALEKLNEGGYGSCDVCGNDIAAERLEILPWATVCFRCASAR